MRRCGWIIAVLAGLLALTACTGPVEAPVEEKDVPEEIALVETSAEEEEEPIPQPGGQEVALKAYEQILEAVGVALPHEPEYPNYPEEFGEAYYEEGYLWICLTENSRELRDKYRAMVDTPQILQFVEVAHSYNDLYALQMAVVKIEGLTFSSVGVNVRENRVDIGIPDLEREAEMVVLLTQGLPQEVAERFDELPVVFLREDMASTS